MSNQSFQYPVFGAEIKCPHCRQVIPALTLTDSYLCDRHGAFEANPKTKELVHLQSGRHWRIWKNKWYRQHTHPDGLRFEVHEALDRVYTKGYHATKVIIAQRYEKLVSSHLENNTSWDVDAKSKLLKLYGLPVEFSGENNDGEDECWKVINFILEQKPGKPSRYPYFRLFE